MKEELTQPESIIVDCAFCDNMLDLAKEDTCSVCGRSHFEDPTDVFTTNDLLAAFNAGIDYMDKNIRPENKIDFESFYKKLKTKKQ